MGNSDDDWRARHHEDVTASVEYFSSDNKFEREKWVVSSFLRACGISFEERELRKAAEPVDVKFREANFQIKEIMDPGRQRGDEYKEQLRKIARAESPADLLETYSPRTIEFSEVTLLVMKKAEELAAGKYGPSERQSLDLLFYFNYLDVGIAPPFNCDSGCIAFRSVSVLTNTYSGILIASPSAPAFLKRGLFLKGKPAVTNAI